MRGEREQRYISKDFSRLSSSLVGTAGLQEDMAGPSQSDQECFKILHPGMYAEKLVSACFLFAESDLLGFAIGNELVPLSTMLIFVNTEVAGCDCPGRRRSLETQAMVCGWR